MDSLKLLKNILFLDIETVSCVDEYAKLNNRLKKQWDRKTLFLDNKDALSENEFFFNRAGIYAEFGKIITIAVGFFSLEDKKLKLRIKAFSNDDENTLLLDFKNLLTTHFNDPQIQLCAHNGKEFDFPYICRRMLVNGIPLPTILDISDKKPWEINHLDTLEMWKFGDRKNFTSLDLLAGIFDIETSKDDIDGSMVNHVYYVENGLDRITNYCKKDVAVLAKLYLKLKCLPSISNEDISII